MPTYTPLVELAARKLCELDGRDPDAHCPEAARVGNKKPKNLDVAANAVFQHLSIQSVLISARSELLNAAELTPAEPEKS